MYEKMTIDELKKELLNLEEELEDVEDERMMMLGQSGHHISSTGLALKYAKMISEVNEKIQKVNELISQKN